MALSTLAIQLATEVVGTKAESEIEKKTTLVTVVGRSALYVVDVINNHDNYINETAIKLICNIAFHSCSITAVCSSK